MNTRHCPYCNQPYDPSSTHVGLCAFKSFRKPEHKPAPSEPEECEHNYPANNCPWCERGREFRAAKREPAPHGENCYCNDCYVAFVKRSRGVIDQPTPLDGLKDNELGWETAPSVFRSETANAEPMLTGYTHVPLRTGASLTKPAPSILCPSCGGFARCACSAQPDPAPQSWEQQRDAAAEAYLHNLWQRPGDMELMDEQFMIFKAGADCGREQARAEIERLERELELGRFIVDDADTLRDQLYDAAKERDRYRSMCEHLAGALEHYAHLAMPQGWDAHGVPINLTMFAKDALADFERMKGRK